MDNKTNPKEELSVVETIYPVEFNVMIIKMLNKLWKRIDEHRENFNKELGNIKRNQSELKNTITQMKSTQEGMNNRLDIENA